MPNKPPPYPISYTAGNFCVTGYSRTHWELTESYNSYSEYTRYSTATQALVFFVATCMTQGLGIPIEAGIKLCECLEYDVNEAIRATALQTIH